MDIFPPLDVQLAHPVIKACLALHGLTPETVPRTGDRGAMVCGIKQQGALPGLVARDGHASVNWRDADGESVVFGADPRGGTIRFNQDIPETLKQGLHGRPLSALVELPGDPGYLIESVEWEVNGPFAVLRVDVRLPRLMTKRDQT